ncbi:MAG: LamG domain-containing protein [Verrucomicrobiota bacterium]
MSLTAARNVILSGGLSNRIFTVARGGNLQLNNLVLIDGRSTQGGAILVDGGTLTGTGCEFRNHRALAAEPVFNTPPNWAQGGAIMNLGNVFLTNCVFESNAASGFEQPLEKPAGRHAAGGAIANLKTLILSGCVFRQNRAIGEAGSNGSLEDPLGFGPVLWGGPGGLASGGAIYSSATVTVLDCNFIGNECVGGGGGNGYPTSNSGVGSNGGAGQMANGGAICIEQGTATIQRCSFSGNVVTGGNGGLGGQGLSVPFALGVYPQPGGLGGRGGTALGAAIFGRLGQVIVINGTTAENKAIAGQGGQGGPGGDGGPRAYGQRGGVGGAGGNALGGGFYLDTCMGEVSFCTVASNLTVPGGGGPGGRTGFNGAGIHYPAPPGPAGTNNGAGLHIVSGAMFLRNSILAQHLTNNNFAGRILDGGHNISSDTSWPLTQTTSRTNLDAKLGPLAPVGGSNPVMALLPGSPAVDSGSPETFPATDQRGVPRPQGPRADIGAFEGELLFPEITASFAPNRIPENGSTTLRLRIHNPNVFALTQLRITNDLPAQIRVASDPRIALDCPSMAVKADPGQSRIELFLAALGPGESCTVQLDVMATLRGRWELLPRGATRETGDFTQPEAFLLVEGQPLIPAYPVMTVGRQSTEVRFDVQPSGFETMVWLEFGTTPELGNRIDGSRLEAGFFPREIRLAISDLKPDTRYFVRAFASNEQGTFQSDLSEFFTLGTVALPTEQNLLANLSDGGLVRVTCDGDIVLGRPLKIERDTILDASGRKVTLNGNGKVRVVHVLPGVKLTLKNLTIANGFSEHGAGLWNEGIIELIACRFLSNRVAGLPGMNGTNGVDGLPGDLRWPNLGTQGTPGGPGTPGENGKGGAIANHGTLAATDCTFEENQVAGGAGGAGGASGSSGVNTPAVPGNGAVGGYGLGGGLFNAGSIGLTNCTFVGNDAVGGIGGSGGANGGVAYTGIPHYEPGVSAPGGNGQGGGIWNTGTGSVMNCTFYANRSTGGKGADAPVGRHSSSRYGQGGGGGSGQGGAIFNQGELQLLHVTVSENLAEPGPGGLGTWESPPVHDGKPGTVHGLSLWNGTNTLQLKSSLISNIAGTNNIFGKVQDAGFNLCSDFSASFTESTSKGGAEILLGAFGNHGGLTLTIPLLPGSPALNAADPANCPSTDQRNLPRPSGSGCDIGAFEVSQESRPPILTLGYLPERSFPGEPTTLQCSVLNPGPWTLTNLVINILLPAGQRWAVPNDIVAGCGGQVRIIENSAEIKLDVEPGATCHFAGAIVSEMPGWNSAAIVLTYAQSVGTNSVIAVSRLIVPAAPAVETFSSLGKAGALPEVLALIDARGLPTRVFFEYGLTTDYGLETESIAVGEGIVPITVQQRLSGLVPGQIYHFRAVAINERGRQAGEDQTFVSLLPERGRALQLVHTNAFFVTPDLRSQFTNKSVTVEFWFNAFEPGGILTEIDRPSAEGAFPYANVQIRDTGEVFVWATGHPPVLVGLAQFGTWHHAALRYDSIEGQLDGFLDGKRLANAKIADRISALSGTSGMYFATPLAPLFGFAQSPGVWRGVLDEVRIWNYARSEAEIVAHFNKTLTGDEPGLAGYWMFNESEPATLVAHDSAAANRRAFIQHAEWVASGSGVGFPAYIAGPAIDLSKSTCRIPLEVMDASADGAVWIEYGLNLGDEMTLRVPAILPAGHGLSQVSFTPLESLFPACQYQYRLVVENQYGAFRGRKFRFTTLGDGGFGSANLDGIDDFVETPDLKAFFKDETFTVEIWFKPLTAGTLMTEKGQSPPAVGWQDGQLDILDSGSLIGRVWDLPFIFMGYVRFGEWNHAVLRYDKSTARLNGFLNGNLSPSSSVGDRQAPWENQLAMIYAFGLGDFGFQNRLNRSMRGEIAELRLWNIARTDQQIQSTTSRVVSSESPGLILHWKFQSEGASRAMDSTPNQLHGRLRNGATWNRSDVPIGGSLFLIQRRKNGDVHLVLRGELDRKFQFETSDDLNSWRNLRTGRVPSTGLLEILDSSAQMRGAAYYRATPID